jgi:carnitine 3-dehydrogenase
LIDRMVEGTQAQAAGRSIRELERLRDDYLVAIQQVLRQYNIGAGATLRSLEERLYRDSARLQTAKPSEAGTALRLLDASVRPEWVDYNKHMSDFRYGQLFGEAMEAIFRQVGVDEAYRQTGRMYYTVESHIKHLGEAKVGEPLYVTGQILSLDEKRLHVVQRMYRSRDQQQIATAEQLYLHVDTAAAKAAPADPRVRAKLQGIFEAHSSVPTPVDVGHAVGRTPR